MSKSTNEKQISLSAKQDRHLTRDWDYIHVIPLNMFERAQPSLVWDSGVTAQQQNQLKKAWLIKSIQSTQQQKLTKLLRHQVLTGIEAINNL